jgi:hypothetical protein
VGWVCSWSIAFDGFVVARKEGGWVLLCAVRINKKLKTLITESE